MMVTFVSQCEKKALNRTRRVLDSFADRIGDNTWQTVITQEGLNAVKKLLRKTASKNTAVSCHWIRSRSRSELVWVVGNRKKFNEQGVVPVNSTSKSIIGNQWENDWQYLPLIKPLTTLAALFHDWGKASEFFQNKLMQKGVIGDPWRHEWISLLFISALTKDKTDKEWMKNLASGEIDFEGLVKKLQNNKRPFKHLPDAALLLGWLIVTHHRLPVNLDRSTSKTTPDFRDLLKSIQADWNYQNEHFDDFEKELKRCFDYSNGLPSDAKGWLKEVKKQTHKLLDVLPLLQQTIEDGGWRMVLQYCRLCLMLGDHYYSSLEPDNKLRIKQRELTLLANTDKNNQPKQTLDEHLLGVARQALRTAHFLPVFEGRSFNGEDVFLTAQNISSLKKQSANPSFKWQDTAVNKIKQWRKQQTDKLDENHFGFFAVNMASTGKGKTFANAKIMRALSVDGDSLRYILALGLRTLTLQTGDEYRNRIGLTNEDLAVLIGSRAIQDLHLKNQKSGKQGDELNYGGSESVESLLDNELDFESVPYIEEILKPVLHKSKDRKFLYAPVLACTIDHIISATEVRRGGRYILPILRLMYSDLVIDEIDDFDDTDLVAIGRLIHLVGMLGRKVMISSATIPPDLAEGYFNTYQSGWAIFAQMRNKNPQVGCAWVDECKTDIQNITAQPINPLVDRYRQYHECFVQKRIQKLTQQLVKRKAEIIPLQAANDADEITLEKLFYHTIQQAVLAQHQRHAHTDSKTGKQVSFGVVRIANIAPCIELSRYFLSADWGEDTEIRAMAYHSQQVLIMRHAQERHLDEVLNRKAGKQGSLDHPLIRKHLNSVRHKNVIFILVATPVEEVGRDHDFDWAVIEPSSYRSFIQLAGRVLRHQEMEGNIDSPNISILQTNRKALMGKKIAFNRPGYESNVLKLKTHDLELLLDSDAIAKRLDASPRIQRKDKLEPDSNFADLEHEAIHRLLTNYDQQGADSMQDWLTGCWWLTAMPQSLIRFRQSSPQQILYLALDGGQWKFCEKNQEGKPEPVEKIYNIEHEEDMSDKELDRLWLKRDYRNLLEEMDALLLEQASMIYGEINLIIYNNDTNTKFYYSPQLGMLRK